MAGDPSAGAGGGFAGAAALLAGQAGLLFGWSPDAFWRATPAELAVLAGAMRGGEAAAPVDLAALMERFPDG